MAHRLQAKVLRREDEHEGVERVADAFERNEPRHDGPGRVETPHQHELVDSVQHDERNPCAFKPDDARGSGGGHRERADPRLVCDCCARCVKQFCCKTELLLLLRARGKDHGAQKANRTIHCYRDGVLTAQFGLLRLDKLV